MLHLARMLFASTCPTLPELRSAVELPPTMSTTCRPLPMVAWLVCKHIAVRAGAADTSQINGLNPGDWPWHRLLLEKRYKSRPQRAIVPSSICPRRHQWVTEDAFDAQEG